MRSILDRALAALPELASEVRPFDLVHTQRLLGHSSITLTERHYTDLGVEEIRAAMGAVPATASEKKEVG